jgi:hypothetical protein
MNHFEKYFGEYGKISTKSLILVLITNAINDLSCILSCGLCDAASVQESETHLGISGGEAGNDNERDR